MVTVKKILYKTLSALFAVCLCASAAVACDGGDSGGKELPMLTVGEVLELLSGGDAECGNYDKAAPQKYVAPFWDSQVIYNESAFFVAAKDGSIAPLGLAFPAAKILSVRKSNDLGGTVYEEATDYLLNADGKLEIPEGSRLPYMSFADYFPVYTSPGSDDWYYKHADGTITGCIKSADAIRPYELAVTYIRTQKYTGVKPQSRQNELPLLKNKMQGAFNVLYIGDSITAGAGPSKNYAPFVPAFCDMASDAIAVSTGREANRLTTGMHQVKAGAVNYYNAGVGGINCVQYGYMLDNMPAQMPYASDYVKNEAVAKTPLMRAMLAEADLVVMAFGMNDGGGWYDQTGNGASSETFKLLIDALLAKIDQINPAAAILLVSCMKSNEGVYTAASCAADKALYGANTAGYEQVLKELAAQYDNLALTEVWGVEQYFLQSKPLINFIADGRNHPNDFTTRIYAQSVAAAVLPDGKPETFPKR